MSEGDEREIEEGVLVHEYCTYPGRGVRYVRGSSVCCLRYLTCSTSTGRDYWLRSPVIFLFAGSLPQRTGELGLSSTQYNNHVTEERDRYNTKCFSILGTGVSPDGRSS